MIVTNRKLFKKRPARDRLNQAAGIMASSPELMGEVQGFQNGGNVQLPGTVGSIVQMLDAVTELPEIVVRGIKSKFSPKTPVNPIQEVPVTMPNGEPGFAIYENGKLKGYTTSPSSQPMIKDRSKQIKEITSEVRPPVNVSSTSLSNLLRGLVGADKGKSEAVQEFEEAKKRGELGIQDSRLLDLLGGRGTYAEKGLTGILRLVPELQEFVGDLSGSALDLLRQPTEETKTESVSQTLPGVNYRSEDFPEGIPKDTPVSVGATTEQIFDLISQGTGPKGDPETVEQILKQMEIDRITAESIQKGQEDTERMKGPVAPTTSLSSRVEKVKAERDAIEAKEQQDFERAIFAGQAREKFFDPLSVEKFLEQRPIATEIGGEDPRVNLPPGAFPKADKQVEELNNIVSGNKKYDGDDKTFDAMGDLDINQKRAIVNQIDNIVETTTGSDLDDLMKEFIGKAPEYKGVNKGLTIAKIGFAIAAGKSADGIQNIADGLSMGADMLLTDKKEKDAFDRQIKLAALQYGLGEISKERDLQRQDKRDIETYVVAKEFTFEGQTFKPGQDITLTRDQVLKFGPNLKNLSTLDAFQVKSNAIVSELEARAKLAEANASKIGIEYKDFKGEIDDYKEALKSAKDAELAKTYISSALINIAENDVFSLKAGGKELLRKVSTALGVNLFGGKTKNFSNVDLLRRDLKLALNSIIPLVIGDTQSANSISDRDVTFVIGAFLDEGIIQRTQGGSFAFVGGSEESVARGLGAALDRINKTQEESFGVMNRIESNFYNIPIEGFNKTGGQFLSGEIEDRKKSFGGNMYVYDPENNTIVMN